ncbi:MAG: rod shape-determining protein MreD [Ndongobacter sp.]|nr:rod shape-determining protein MreD [Ndongobacter sp.]
MNKGRFALCLVGVQIIQNTVLSRVSFFDARIDLTLVFVIALSILYGPKWGGYTGVGLGLLEDIVFAEVLGIRALLYFLVAEFVGEMMRNTSGNLAIGAVATAVATLFMTFAGWLIHWILRHNILNLWYVRGPLFLEMVFNTVLFFAVMVLLRRFLKPSSVQKYTGY